MASTPEATLTPVDEPYHGGMLTASSVIVVVRGGGGSHCHHHLPHHEDLTPDDDGAIFEPMPAPLTPAPSSSPSTAHYSWSHQQIDVGTTTTATNSKVSTTTADVVHLPESLLLDSSGADDLMTTSHCGFDDDNDSSRHVAFLQPPSPSSASASSPTVPGDTTALLLLNSVALIEHQLPTTTTTTMTTSTIEAETPPCSSGPTAKKKQKIAGQVCSDQQDVERDYENDDDEMLGKHSSSSKQQQQPSSSACCSTTHDRQQAPKQPRRSNYAAARSFFARLRNRLKPIVPCQALHLVPSSSVRLSAAGADNSEMEQQQQQQQQQQPKKQKRQSKKRVQADVIVEPPLVRKIDDGIARGTVANEADQQQPRVTLIESSVVRCNCCRHGRHLVPVEVTSTTTVEIATSAPPLCFQQHRNQHSSSLTADHQQQLPAPYISAVITSTPFDSSNRNNSNNNTNNYANYPPTAAFSSSSHHHQQNSNNYPSTHTASSSGFFSSSSFSKTARSPSTFSPTGDELATSTSLGPLQSSQQVNESSKSHRLPTSQSCPLSGTLLTSPSANSAPVVPSTSSSRSKKKKQPPLVKFNQLGDISPTLKERQSSLTPSATDSPVNNNAAKLPQLNSTTDDTQETTQPRRFFSRSFLRGTQSKRQSFFNRSAAAKNQTQQQQHSTMPSLHEGSHGYESDGENKPHRSNSLSSIILAFLRGRSLRSTSPRPRVASPVGPRLSPDSRRARAGYHCDVAQCHCHEFPYAYGSLRSTAMHRPHLKPQQQRPASFHSHQSNSFLQVGNNNQSKSPPKSAAFLRGYGPNAPDDPAPQFHHFIAAPTPRLGASLAVDTDSFYDDDEILVCDASTYRQPGFVAGPQMTSTPFVRTASPQLYDRKCAAQDSGNGMSTFLSPVTVSNASAERTWRQPINKHSSAAKGVSFVKPPPIVTFAQNTSEEDLLYRDGDLIQSCNGALLPQGRASIDSTEQLMTIQLDHNKSTMSRRTLLFPRSPESPPVQRMPVVFLPAYPITSSNARNNCPRMGSIATHQNSVSTTSSNESNRRGSNGKSNATRNGNNNGLPIFRQQQMTPLRS